MHKKSCRRRYCGESRHFHSLRQLEKCSTYLSLSIILIYTTGFPHLCQALFFQENQMFFCKTQSYFCSCQTSVKRHHQNSQKRFYFSSKNSSCSHHHRLVYEEQKELFVTELYLQFMFLCSKEIFCLFCNNSAQCKQCDHIRNCHQTIKDICDSPYCTYCHVWSDEYCEDV